MAVPAAYFGQYWLSKGLIEYAFAAAVVVGFLSGAIATGTLKGALWGAASAAVFFGIGSYFQVDKLAAGGQAAKDGAIAAVKSGMTAGQTLAKIAAHAGAGGTLNMLQGGKFGHGFVAAGFTEALSPAVGQFGDGESFGSILANTAVSAAIGGTASKLSGGSFANGAKTGAFASLFSAAVQGAESGADQSNASTTSEYPLADEGPHVTMVCRPTWGVGAHCGTFVWIGTAPTQQGITQQFSLEGFTTSFVNPVRLNGTAGTFNTDRAAFLNPGGRNQHFLIAPPSGVTQATFSLRVTERGNSYGVRGGTVVPGYRLFRGPNSNSAAAYPIIYEGGAIPNVWNAPAINFWERRP